MCARGWEKSWRVGAKFECHIDLGDEDGVGDPRPGVFDGYPHTVDIGYSVTSFLGAIFYPFLDSNEI